MTRNRADWRRLVFLSILLAVGVAAPSARAGPLLASAGNCPTTPLGQPFARWGDSASYMLVPQGSFEAGTAGWKLSSASVVSGNETFYVHSSKDSRSLSISSGGYATSATACVDVSKPIMRFFARSSGGSTTSLKVEALYEDAAGKVQSLSIGSVKPGAWAPASKMTVTVSLLPLLSNNRSPVQYRFTPIGSAGWQIDDVYVDPRRH